MAGSLAPLLKQRYFDANGNPLAGGKLYTYQSGTTTPQATYTNSGLGTANANPVVLDANGEAAVWLDPALSYKFVLKDSSDVTQFTTDGVIGILTADAVPTTALQDSAVTTAKIADDAVTAAKLKDSAGTDADRAVTTDHIRDLAVTTAKLNAEAVTRAKLAAGAVAAHTLTASKTTTYTATNADDMIPCSASGGAFTVTLYAASGNSGRRIVIKKTDSSFNAVTIDANASETIDGQTTTTLNTQYETVELVCDGSNWFIVSRTYPSGWVESSGFTPAAGYGTVTLKSIWYKREGDSVSIRGYFKGGTVAATSAKIGLPTGIALDTTKVPSTNNVQRVGWWNRVENGASTNIIGANVTGVIYLNTSDPNSIFLAGVTDTNVFTDGNANTFLGNDDAMSFDVTTPIPVLGWKA